MLDKANSEFRLRLFRERVDEIVSSSKNSQDRNICVLNLTMIDGAELYYYSYSSTSSLSVTEKQKLANWGFILVPDVPGHLKFYACGGMGQYHTEPRLINYINASPGVLENIANILIITEIDCCATCLKYTISEFQKVNPRISFWTNEFNKIPKRDKKPDFKYYGPLPLMP